MQVKCGRCGTTSNVEEAQLVARQRVQFRCPKCGQNTQLAAHDQRTQMMPASRPRRSAGVDATIVSRLPGLELPKDKRITLSVLSGSSKGVRHEMNKPRVTVGRAGGGADIQIDDPEVSRQHCAVEVEQQVVRLRDLGSTNGTWLGEASVRAAELEHLSEFRVGGSQILLTILPK